MKVKPFISNGSTSGYWAMQDFPGFMVVRLCPLSSLPRWCVKPNPNFLPDAYCRALSACWRSSLAAQRFATRRDALDAFQGFVALSHPSAAAG